MYQKINSSVIWARIFRWEFWPFSVFYFPVFFYWAWCSLRAKSLFFFTASNPSIDFGGMLGESKKKIFDLIPESYIPQTYLLSAASSTSDLLHLMEKHQLTYPVILKPDIGERGWMVELIKSEKQLNDYCGEIKVDFLLQEYVPHQVELGVFYYRYPDRPRGTVSSIVIKDMLKVIGDGTSSVQSLMEEGARSKMHINRLIRKDPQILRRIPEKNEPVEIVSIGNHCLGTTFYNGNQYINEKIRKVFDEISCQIEGFYFGRYDLRCASIADLNAGKNFKILELNGAGAEPAHIYHPGYSLIQAYKDIIHHLRVLTDISIMNHRNGIAYMSFMDGLREVKKIRQYNREKVINK